MLGELRDFVIDGYLRLARGGIEVGGVLFGKREGSEVRVLAWRPIACEHSTGPSFELSEKDQGRFEQMLAATVDDPGLMGLEAVGWFVSHTRSEVHIRPEELVFWDRYFPQESQIALVLKPARFQPVRAGFFFRNNLGHIEVNASLEEFTLPADEHKQRAEKSKPHEPFPMGGSALVQAHEPRKPAVIIEATLPISDEIAVVREHAELRPTTTRRRAWGMFLSVIAGALLGSIIRIGLIYYWDTHPDSLGLKLNGQSNELLVQWDREQIRQLNAQNGEITITEDSRALVKRIDGEALKLGTFAYQTQGREVKVQLRVFRDGHEAIVETARLFTQPAPPPPPNLVDELTDSKIDKAAR